MALSKITDTLYIGNWQDAAAQKINPGIYIMTVAFDSPFTGGEKFDLVDGPSPGNEEIFWSAVKRLDQLQSSVIPTVTLVHCVSGLSRSVSVVIAYLMKSRNISFGEAQYMVQCTRYCATKPFFVDLLTRKSDT